MKDFTQGVIAGVALGALSLVLFLSVTPNIVTRAHEVLDSCQASLPRDQDCVLTAIPVEE